MCSRACRFFGLVVLSIVVSVTVSVATMKAVRFWRRKS